MSYTEDLRPDSLITNSDMIGDYELEELYRAVWAGYVVEVPALNANSLEHGSDTPQAQTENRPASPSPFFPPGPARQNPIPYVTGQLVESPVSARPVASPATGRAPRPLPPTPGGSSIPKPVAPPNIPLPPTPIQNPPPIPPSQRGDRALPNNGTPNLYPGPSLVKNMPNLLPSVFTIPDTEQYSTTSPHIDNQRNTLHNLLNDRPSSSSSRPLEAAVAPVYEYHATSNQYLFPQDTHRSTSELSGDDPSHSFDYPGTEEGYDRWQSQGGTVLTSVSVSEFPILTRPDQLPANFNPYASPPGDDPDADDNDPLAAIGRYANVPYDNRDSAGSYLEDEWEEVRPDRPEGPSHVARNMSQVLRDIENFDPTPRDLEEGEWYEEASDGDDETRYINTRLLSNIAVHVRDRVPRGTHVKGSIPYPNAFTGKDIVSTIHSVISRELVRNHGLSPDDRRIALDMARSLQNQLFFYEVEWGARVLQDNVEDVYMFLDELEGPSDGPPEQQELPTGVTTSLTHCYSTNCGDGLPCYSPRCPRRGDSFQQNPSNTEAATIVHREEWSQKVHPEFLSGLSETEKSRQTIIHKLISKEEQYLEDLDMIESTFIKPLRAANPPVMSASRLDDFIDDVFGNILDLRDSNKRLLEEMYIRQREQAPVIQRIGDIFLNIATEFRENYPIYVGHHPLAEKQLREELESNAEFRLFIEKCTRRQVIRQGESVRIDLRQALSRPGEHLNKYPVLLEAILGETAPGNPDSEFLSAAISALKNLQTVAQLRTFQSAMGRGAAGRWEWHDIMSPDERHFIKDEESKRQSIIFELIKGEMTYVRDLENIEKIFLRPLRNANPPIIPPDRLNSWTTDVFHNFGEIYAHHRKLLGQLHDIQLEEHPRIKSIVAPLFDAALNFREAYLEYIPNYPIAEYRINDEMEKNPAFKTFIDECVRHPDSHRLDMKNFVNRPIPRLLRYELLLRGILDVTLPGHEDKEAIPQVIEIIKALGKETEHGVQTSKQKVELWIYNSNLVFKPGEIVDMDLLNENRSLVHTGKLSRQDGNELFVLLFDNYLVMTKPKEKEGVTRYHLQRRPIPLEMLTLGSFADPPTMRQTGLLRNLRDRRTEDTTGNQGNRPVDGVDSRFVYPFTFSNVGRTEGTHLVYAESQVQRDAWKRSFEDALGLRTAVQEHNKVFEMETLSSDTFVIQTSPAGNSTWNDGAFFTGKVTCSVPFSTFDRRGLVAIGCAEGLWIGFRHDSKSMRRVLHVRMITQCAILEDFGLFLVLADKSLFAYHLEALVPSQPGSPHASQAPQKLGKDISFFRIGNLGGRTLVIYMRKKGVESHFYLMEPVIDKINEGVKPTSGIGIRIGIQRNKTDWFRNYKYFYIPSEAYDVVVLKARLAILCAKGFEIMDLNSLSSVNIPSREDARYSYITKRCDSCRPLGMFRSTDDEFLLCYNEFGVYVDKHGDPSRHSAIVEWEGSAESAALHPPYILLFDSRFIEIRYIETGRLAQIVLGEDIRCLWDGASLDSNPAITPGSRTDDHMVQEARIHAVMNMTEPVPTNSLRPNRVIAQHVFELVPTIPLYLPGSLASPSSVPYFPQSFSPPRSPPLRASNSLRA
ncbi:hypothetical protein BDN72DRAFT_837648 [Pluteus cervinus]|uniref:Uncharacterized protein n=1 Tax=Pluteus cervinus TaxID=181527 RepID=A0ACD3B1G0_9AGAR|nr:hypothetical protein BDN72DRAFT_837648 [Pluteus cervinus]